MAEQQIFNIEIPNERLKIYRLVTFIILSLNFFGFGFVFFKTTGIFSLLAFFLLAFNAVPWIYYVLNKKHLNSPLIEIPFIASACLWFFVGNEWMALFLILFAVAGHFANKKTVVKFSIDGITYPSFLPEKYAWQDVQNVIWKDDMLTIDLKNNKLLQTKIDKNISENFDGDSFNNWCKPFLSNEK